MLATDVIAAKGVIKIMIKTMITNSLGILGAQANAECLGGQALLALLQSSQAFATVSDVLVTGAGGKTGQLVFDLLQKDPNVEPVGLVRSQKKTNLLKKQ